MSYVGDEFKEHSWVVNTAETQRHIDCERFEDWYRWNQDLKSMEAETRKITSVRKQLGWTNCNMMKRVASMPLHIFHILRTMDPELFANTKEGRRKFDRFLIRHPEFSVR